MELAAISAGIEAKQASLRRSGLYWIAIATAAASAFQIAFEIPALNCIVLLYAIGLIWLSRVSTARVAFRLGFLSGLLVFVPQLAWFWRIFGAASLSLWAVLSFFAGLFVFALNRWRVRFGPKWLWVVAPILWTGLEYFRGELYFLRFSWLSVGYVFSGNSGALPVGFLGVYGCGFAVFLIAAFVLEKAQKNRVVLTIAALFAIAGLVALPKKSARFPTLIVYSGLQVCS